MSTSPLQHEELRKAFRQFFTHRSHQWVDSHSLVPQNDPSLIFTNAGMNPFKDIFLGHAPAPSPPNLVSIQKCMRAGGKHNDLENVGHTPRHHTFFEMMGNFSFGGYGKKQAILYAWEFLTQTLSLPTQHLYASVFEKDTESYALWQSHMPQERIFKLGETDNFWRMGQTGPCGPCSEIYFGPQNIASPQELEALALELWNLVFMEFNEEQNGTQTPLPTPCIDTGMGLERLAAVVDFVRAPHYKSNKWSAKDISNYSTTLFTSIIKDLSATSTASELLIMADHARAACFLIDDGVFPSNDGRGYVLRRILRRALKAEHDWLKQRSLKPGAFVDMIKNCISSMQVSYPRLKQNQNTIINTCQEEARAFTHTLSRGLKFLNTACEKARSQNHTKLSGEAVFKLYETYGLPVDIVQNEAKKHWHLDIDKKAFEKVKRTSSAQSRATWQGQKGPEASMPPEFLATAQKQPPTQFIGYKDLETRKSTLTLCHPVRPQKDQIGYFVFDKTPFYSTGGGQVADQGTFKSSTGTAKVLGCEKQNTLHIVKAKVVDGFFEALQNVHQQVCAKTRFLTACNHSATHLLNHALRGTLGSHIVQAGSFVGPEYLRFDFRHPKPVGSQELKQLEDHVMAQIQAAHPVQAQEMDFEQATQTGAITLPEQEYSPRVRTLRFGQSFELCGGTHVENTRQIGAFVIVSESSIGAGTRRIEAISAITAVQYAISHLRVLDALQEPLGFVRKGRAANAALGKFLADKCAALQEENTQLKKQALQIQNQKQIENLLKSKEHFNVTSQSGHSLGLWRSDVVSSKIDPGAFQGLLKNHPVVVVLLKQPKGPTKTLVLAQEKSPLGAKTVFETLKSHFGGRGGGNLVRTQGQLQLNPNWQELEPELKRVLKTL